MAGQLIKRGDNVWLVRVFLGRDENGKRLFHNHTVHGTKKDAQRYLTGVLQQRDAGTWIPPQALALDAFLDEWLATVVAHRVRPRTYDSYAGLLKRHVRPVLGTRRLQDLRPGDLQALYASLLTQNLSARTVRYVHTVLANALKQAVRWQLLSHSPAEAVELPHQAHREMQALSPDEAKSFLESAKPDPWYVLFLAAIVTGMRPGELLGLQWKDIDWSKGTAVVRRALVRRDDQSWSFEEPKTARSRRTIPLTASLIKALQTQHAEQAAARLAAGPKYANHDLVFANLHGEPLVERNVVRHHFKPILVRAGLPASLRLYDLRHTCATLLLAQGENPKIVSERLGHASITLTLDTYSHVLPTMQEAAAWNKPCLENRPLRRWIACTWSCPPRIRKRWGS